MRTIESLGYKDNVDVYTASETYNPGDGYDESFSLATSFSGIVTTPEEMSEKDRGGLQTETDLVVYKETSGGRKLPSGGEAPLRIEVDSLPGRYKLVSEERQQDGLTRIECVEVD